MHIIYHNLPVHLSILVTLGTSRSSRVLPKPVVQNVQYLRSFVSINTKPSLIFRTNCQMYPELGLVLKCVLEDDVEYQRDVKEPVQRKLRKTVGSARRAHL